MPIGFTAGPAAVTNGAGSWPTTVDVRWWKVVTGSSFSLTRTGGTRCGTAGRDRASGTADGPAGRPAAAVFAWAAAPVDRAGSAVTASRRRLGVANARGDGVDATTGAIEVD